MKPAIGNKMILGKEKTKAENAMTSAIPIPICGYWKNGEEMSFDNVEFLLFAWTLEMSSPDERAIPKDDVWEISPSPKVSFKNTDAALSNGQPHSITAMPIPTKLLRKMMKKPAKVSPLMYFEAPSIAP